MFKEIQICILEYNMLYVKRMDTHTQLGLWPFSPAVLGLRPH